MWGRLGRDHFLGTNEPSVRRELSGRVWFVCEEYEIQELPQSEWIRQTDKGGVGMGPTKGPTKIVNKYPLRRQDKWRTYDPIKDTPDLFLTFARLYEGDLLGESILNWVQRHGFLGIGHELLGGLVPEELTEDFRLEVMRAAAVLAAYEAVLNDDDEAAKRVVFENYPHIFTRDWTSLEIVREEEILRDNIEETVKAIEEDYDGDHLWYALAACSGVVEEMVRTFCWPTLRVEEKPREFARATAGWGTSNLLGAMYLQMYWLMAAGGEVTRCRYCGRLISLVSPKPGDRKVRQDRKYCDDACRQRYHYHTKTKPKRLGKRLPS